MFGMYMLLLENEEQKSKFEHIYRKYAGFMYHVALETAHEHFLAEDAVHETFLDLVRIIDEVRTGNEKELMSFLRILTYHETVDLMRDAKKYRRMDDSIEAETDVSDNVDVEAVVIQNVDYENLLHKLSEMDEKYKTPLQLKAQGYKVKEIADILKITEQNAKIRLYRARKMLLDELEGHNE